MTAPTSRFVRPLSTALLVAAFTLGGCAQEVAVYEGPTYNAPQSENEPSDWGAWLSMDVAPDGQRLVAAYYIRDSGALGFATGTPAADGTISWFHERVDGFADANGLPVGDRGTYASLRTAPDGTVWIAYHAADKSGLFVAHRKGGANSWETYSVIPGTGEPGGTGMWASLALDANGFPVIASHNGADGTLQVSRLADTDSGDYSQWTTAVAQTGTAGSVTDAEGVVTKLPASVGAYARLEIFGTTEIIAYYDAGQQRLGLLEGVAGSYNQSFVSEAGQNMGAWPSILQDAGTVSIAFQDIANQDLMLATRAAGGFTIERVDEGPYRGADTEIIKRNGTVGILYFDGQDNDLRYVDKSGTLWVNSEVNGTGAASGYHNEVVRIGEDWWSGTYDYVSRKPIFQKL